VSAIRQPSQQPPYPVPGTDATLADAARTNNFPLFDALYLQGGPDAARFGELHAFWKWSMTDRVGGFYGDDVHAKFAAEYRDYAEFIADYGIVDAHGRAFYPSAETRAFLLGHALKGDAPLVRVAAAKKPRAAVVRHKQPIVVEQTLASVPLPIPASAFAPAARIVAAPQPKPQPAVVAQQPQPKPEPAPVPESDGRLARGFVLIVVGLLAAGTLSLVFHTPKETT
jgi:hypothetical protein